MILKLVHKLNKIINNSMESDPNKIEFNLIMRSNIKDIEAKAKNKEEQYIKVKQKFCDSSEKFDSFPLEEEKSIIDMHESSDDTPPFTLKSQFLKNLSSEKNSLDKSKSQETDNNLIFNEFTIKNLNTGESYDIRNKDIIDNLTAKSQQIEINKEKAWQDYW